MQLFILIIRSCLSDHDGIPVKWVCLGWSHLSSPLCGCPRFLRPFASLSHLLRFWIQHCQGHNSGRLNLTVSILKANAEMWHFIRCNSIQDTFQRSWACLGQYAQGMGWGVQPSSWWDRRRAGEGRCCWLWWTPRCNPQEPLDYISGTGPSFWSPDKENMCKCINTIPVYIFKIQEGNDILYDV